MRARADTPTIRVGCGHRVPRVFVLSEPNRMNQRTRLYWCETCSRYRMSGNKVTGEHGFDFLLELRDEIVRHGVTVDDPGTDRGRAVVHALGAHIRQVAA